MHKNGLKTPDRAKPMPNLQSHGFDKVKYYKYTFNRPNPSSKNLMKIEPLPKYAYRNRNHESIVNGFD